MDSHVEPEEMSKILTSIGLEVESMELREAVAGGLQGVVVGEVLTCQKHPDADKLHITTVNVGGEAPLNVVCGAPNVGAGQKVLCATIGTKLHIGGDQITIKKSKIRGAESEGMLCAEDELGLGTSHSGIMVLPADARVGTPAKDYFNLQDDYLIEIGLTPNRIDAASHFGVVRDLVTSLNFNGHHVKKILPSVEEFRVHSTKLPIPVEVVDKQACTRYAGLTISGVTVKQSPDWLQNRLRSIGLNPINNVVDVTNFVLHEIGQPLHAFDAAKIVGEKVVVKTLPQNTPFVTLDGVERKLGENDLMICNAAEPMCIAGVFGGLGSGVTESTTSIFLESACFNPVYVRKTARRHGLSTDASFRFERGVDPNITIWALKRAALLIVEVAGGEVSSQIVDVYPQPVDKYSVEFNVDRANRLIGVEIPASTIENILTGLEIEVESKKGATWMLRVPTYRVDVTREADVVEDILRIYGYNNVPMPAKVSSTLSYSAHPDSFQMQSHVSDFLSSNGFNEIMCNSLTKGAYYHDLKTYPDANSVKIINPLSNDLNVMRQTLLFGGLESVQRNTNFRNLNQKLYEFGNCYSFNPNAEVADSQNGLARYSESYSVALWMTGLVHEEHWADKPCKVTFFHIKGVVGAILERFGFNLDKLQTTDAPADIFEYGITYSHNGTPVATLGAVSSALTDQFDIKAEVFFAQIEWHLLMKQIAGERIVYREVAKFPAVRRDLALMVDSSVRYEQIRALALSTERKLLKHVNLFDVYQGKNLPEGKKSLAVSFILQDENRTLTDEQIEKTMRRFVEVFGKELGAALR